MDLIIGGAYQGKLDYAKETFRLGNADLCVCSRETGADFSRRCLDRFEEYVLWALRNGAAGKLPPLRDDAVVICRDIFCGVVSTDAETRLWREEAGRTLAALAARADTVTRVFCGLPQRLK
jgi:adenosyl cobinamide kinase/adenosyl cobinamide phosphate guanylyltransferase